MLTTDKAKKRHQRLPSSGPEREALRKKGQFWTPSWVAEAMVAYVIGDDSDHIFDPAVGEGAFFRAAKAIAKGSDRRIELIGTEVDPGALEQALANGLSSLDLTSVQIADFVSEPPAGPFKAIVANPPYIRHHRLPRHFKERLRSLSMRIVGVPLDGRAGLHIFFLLRALQLLDEEGRLAFIMPADTCEGIFAPTLWKWITAHFCLDGVITFAPEASPFPGVDTNALVLMIRKAAPQEYFPWVRCHRADPGDLMKVGTLSRYTELVSDSISVIWRSLQEGLATGLSREPVQNVAAGPVLGNYAKVLRGIATGSNGFFFLTIEQARTFGIPKEFLALAVGRTRDVPGDELTEGTIAALTQGGRPTLLFSPDGRRMENFPLAVQRYLKQGEEMGLNNSALISQRRPWYKMETRRVPPFLFAYLGRRNTRFIRNRVGAVPLTGFLCVYPKSEEVEYVEKLWQVLKHPETIANLALVGKSYGAGAIKVEPRALERLPLPPSVVARVGLPTSPPTGTKSLPDGLMQASFDF